MDINYNYNCYFVDKSFFDNKEMELYNRLVKMMNRWKISYSESIEIMKNVDLQQIEYRSITEKAFYLQRIQKIRNYFKKKIKEHNKRLT